jgi:beta-lactam-binding protein with PASTA domain
MSKKRKFRLTDKVDSATGDRASPNEDVSGEGDRSAPLPRGGVDETLPSFTAITSHSPRDASDETAAGPAQPTSKADATVPRLPSIPINDSISTGGREVSLFADKPELPPKPAPGPVPLRRPAPGPATTQAPRPSAGGDTTHMKSITGAGPAPEDLRLKRAPRAERDRMQMRVAEVRRRDARPQYGFFSVIFGFFGMIFKMAIVTALVMGICVLIGYESIRVYVKTKQVTVPNVKGMRMEDAVDILSPKKLSLVKERAEPSGLVAPGEIIDQHPLPGTTAKESATVRVVVSSGRANYLVPDVTNESRDNAINKIKGARLEVGNITYMENDKVPKDVVFNQDPEPNKGLDQPRTVDLLVSSGPKGTSVTMPDLASKSLADAKAALAHIGITDIVTNPPNATEGHVAAQEPLVGKLILQSQHVTLTIGK